MAQFPEDRPSDLDEKLAAFTDRALSSRPDEPVKPAPQDPELFALEQTVLQLKKTFENEMPEAEVAQRIRARLEREWRVERQQAQTKTSPEDSGLRGLLKRFNQLSKVQRQRTLAFGFALACVVLLVGLVVFTPMYEQPSTGAAGMATEWLPITLGIIILAIVAIVWLVRHNDR
jgi:hypothetical protein